MYTKKDHTFAICAYKESEYLEDCIRSVLNQKIKTNVILATSTPNEYILSLCKKYDIPVYINKGEKGITQDWNYAISVTTTDCVTVAHQDDVYDNHYTEVLLKDLNCAKTPIIFFTDYSEIRNGVMVHDNKLLRIKRIMLIALRFKCFQSSRFIRRRILSLGSPICCPSVTFVRSNCPDKIFKHGFRADEDWQAWELLSKLKGSFVYSTKVLTYHRIHDESETSRIIGDNARGKEDYIMFKKFWPSPIARILTKVYGTSEKSNDL